MADNSMEIKTLLELDKDTMEYLKDIRNILLKSSSNKNKTGGSESTTFSSKSSKHLNDYNNDLENLNKQSKKLYEKFKDLDTVLTKNNDTLRKTNALNEIRKNKDDLIKKSEQLKDNVFYKLAKNPFSLENKYSNAYKEFSDASDEQAKLESERFKLAERYRNATSENERNSISNEIKSKDGEIESNKFKVSKAGSKLTSAATKLGTFNLIKKAGDAIFNKASNFYKTLGIDLKGTFNDITNNVREAFGKNGIASYNLGSSLITNSSARESAFKYGLSSSQNYALTQTRQMLNLQSDEDLMYMNDDQKAYFNQLMEKYENWYTKLESSGVFKDVQEMQLEFQMFKQEISYAFLEWFANNKDTIMTVLQGTLEVIETILGVITKLTGGSSSASASDSLSVIQSAKNTTYNINSNSTNNISTGINSTQDLVNAMDSSNSNNLKSLAVAVNSFD